MEALNQGISCVFRRHIVSGEPLGALLLSDAMGRAGSKLCASVQSHNAPPCEACKAGVWRAVHQAAFGLTDEETDDAGNQLSLDNFIKPADWPEGKPWGTLTIDASCNTSRHHLSD